MSRTLVVALILVAGMSMREAWGQQPEEDERRAFRAALEQHTFQAQKRLLQAQQRVLQTLPQEEEERRAARAVLERQILECQILAEMQAKIGAREWAVPLWWTEGQFEGWFLGPLQGRAAARQRFDGQLATKIENLDRAYRLTEAQKQKLRLAGRGDIKRFFDRFDGIKQQFPFMEEDVQKLQAFQQDIQRLQADAKYPFQQDSLLLKTLPNTLTRPQLTRYEEVARERHAFAQVRVLAGHQREGMHAWVTRLTVAPNGRQVVTVGEDAGRLWDVESGKVLRVFGENPRGYWSVAFSRDGRRIAAGSNDHTVRVWDAATGKELQRLKGHTGAVWGVAFSADGRQLITGSWDRSLSVWDLERGKQVRWFEGVHDMVRCLACSPDGQLVAAGHFANHGQEGILRLWDLARGTEIRAFLGHTQEITSVAFSPDGRTLLTASHDNTVRLWDVDSGKEIQRLEGHTHRVEGAAFSPDGRYIVSCGNQHDATVRIWDAARGQELLCSDKCEGGFLAVAMLPELGYVVTTGKDGMVRLWPWRK